MKVLSWDDIVRGTHGVGRPVDLTIGAFDGLHAGHRVLLSSITSSPDQATSLVVTFGTNPAVVLGKGSFAGLLLSHRQKLERLASLGVAAVAVVDFSEELSKLSGKAFIGLLRDTLAIRRIVVGHDFRFGKDRDTDDEGLRGLLAGTGIDLEVKGPVLHHGIAVSSSRIRKSIQEASFAGARAMLLADHALDLRGLAVETRGPGRLSLAREALRQVLPRNGGYRVLCLRAMPEGGEALKVPGRLDIDTGELRLAWEGGAEAAAVIFAQENNERSFREWL